MPHFSRSSWSKLETCHEDLQRLFCDVVRNFDCKVIEGHRTTARQQDLFAQGRTRPGPIVTNCDGVNKKSRHQTSPSVAVDVVPYFADVPHIRWDDRDSFFELAGFVQATAIKLGIRIRWGGHWSRFPDLPHWEVEHEMETDT